MNLGKIGRVLILTSLVSVLSLSSISFAAPAKSLQSINEMKLKHSKSVSEFNVKFKKFTKNTVSKQKKTSEFSTAELNEWEVLYEDLITLLNLSESKEISLFGEADIAKAYDGSSSGFQALKSAVEAAMDVETNDASQAYASKAAADKANKDQQTYMSQKGLTETLDNIVDAFRHFSWNYHLVDTWYVTRSQAKKLTDNHEFAEKGASYGYNNWPNSSDSYQVLQGYTYALDLKDKCLKEYGGKYEFLNLFGPSSLMDFNNNEAGRAYESKNYSNNFTAFDGAVQAGHVTIKPSEWNIAYLQNTAYAIYTGDWTY